MRYLQKNAASTRGKIHFHPNRTRWTPSYHYSLTEKVQPFDVPLNWSSSKVTTWSLPKDPLKMLGHRPIVKGSWSLQVKSRYLGSEHQCHPGVLGRFAEEVVAHFWAPAGGVSQLFLRVGTQVAKHLPTWPNIQQGLIPLKGGLTGYHRTVTNNLESP